MRRLASNLALAVRPWPNFVNAISLAGGATVESLTAPGTAGEIYVCVFGFTAGGCFVRVGSAAAVWTPADTTDGTAFSCAPAAFEVKAGEVISFQCAAACVVTVDFYRSPTGNK